MKSLISFIQEKEQEKLAPNYEIKMNVGKSKYVINYFDGEKKHSDGSPFYDVRIFKNKKVANEFVQELIDKGYKGNGKL